VVNFAIIKGVEIVDSKEFINIRQVLVRTQDQWEMEIGLGEASRMIEGTKTANLWLLMVPLFVLIISGYII